MPGFNGFQESSKRFTGIPDQFFSEILPILYDADAIKITLYILWSAYRIGDFGIGFTIDDFLNDKILLASIEGRKSDAEKTIASILKRLSSENILVETSVGDSIDQPVYFINSPRGRTAAVNYQKQSSVPVKVTLDAIQPNIFRLYEENIGPLTPMIADALKEAESRFSEEWIREAIEIAVSNNVRRWNYIERILERWQEEGRDGTDRRDSQEDYRRYIKGEYGEIGHH